MQIAPTTHCTQTVAQLFGNNLSGQPLATNPWADNQLVLAGIVQNLELARIADSVAPRAPVTIPFEGGESANNLSTNARSQTTSEETYKRLVEEALADLPAIGGKNKQGLPVVVVDLFRWSHYAGVPQSFCWDQGRTAWEWTYGGHYCAWRRKRVLVLLTCTRRARTSVLIHLPGGHLRSAVGIAVAVSPPLWRRFS